MGINVIRRLIVKFSSGPKGVLLLSVGIGVMTVESVSSAVVAVVVVFVGL
jgi:hypothetical protein